MFTLKPKDMYILVSEKDIKSESVKKAYHERMPDGRLIMTPQELKMLGSIPNVQIVSTARELKELMKKPVASDQPTDTPADGQTSGGQTGTDDIDSFFTEDGADTQPDGDTEEEQQDEADESGEAENANTENIGEEETYGDNS